MGLVSGNRLNRFWKKGVKPIKDAIGVLTALSTVDKETLVGAINELAEGKFDKAKLVASTNITEPGFAMDGKTASEAITELYSKITLSALKDVIFASTSDGRYAIHLEGDDKVLQILLSKTYIRLDFYEGDMSTPVTVAKFTPN